MSDDPRDEQDLVDCVRAARAARAPLRIIGGGTRQAIGRPVAAAGALSLRALSGVTLYEPGEMVIAAKAGTPLPEIEALIAARGQMLPFAPMDHRRLLGTQGAPTIGAVAACNISGARRISHGAARDSLIGLRFVNGRGEAIKSGGRVVKNVTGLDLVKLQAGAFGCLGVLSEVTFKLLPKPERAATLVLRDLDDSRAIVALSQGLGSPFEVSGAAHLPAGVAGEQARTLLRIENFASSVAYRIGELQRIVGDGDVLEDAASETLWRDIGDCAFFADDTRAVWRVSSAPDRAPDFVRRIQANGAVTHFYDWGGGLVWLALAARDDARASDIHAAVAAVGGHATLVRAPADIRARVDVFQPLPAPTMRLQAALKASLDPDHLFNPRLMYAAF